VSRWKILITSPQLQRTMAQHETALQRHSIEAITPKVVQVLSEAELLRLVPGMDGMIVGDDPVTAQVLERADRLRAIAKWGVGIDNIDLEAAGQRGIHVTNTPGAFGEEVADVVVGYLILLARGLHRVDQDVRRGVWAKPEGVSLGGRTIGIIGLGDIGSAVARRTLAMGMTVLGADPAPDRRDQAASSGVQILDIRHLLPGVDVLSLNCPLTPESRHMIDAQALDQMKQGVWIINTARGGLIDEGALIAALRDGRVGAAALDVFEAEPLPLDSPLRRMDNVILGSHNSSNTREAVNRTSARAIENLVASLMATKDRS
jgi:D-3-phosphoglycerate dehydrogenase